MKYPRRPRINWSPGQEAVLFLRPQADEGFYTVWIYYDVISKKDNPNFDKELDQVKRCTRLIADPTAGLKSKSAADRFTTAAMLVARYSTKSPGAPPKKEAIDADESKLILRGLADADWAAVRTVGNQPDPLTVFFRLGLTEADGWRLPPDFKDAPDAARNWLKDNADKYRVQRSVAEKKDK